MCLSLARKVLPIGDHLHRPVDVDGTSEPRPRSRCRYFSDTHGLTHTREPHIYTAIRAPPYLPFPVSRWLQLCAHACLQSPHARSYTTHAGDTHTCEPHLHNQVCRMVYIDHSNKFGVPAKVLARDRGYLSIRYATAERRHRHLTLLAHRLLGRRRLRPHWTSPARMFALPWG